MIEHYQLMKLVRAVLQQQAEIINKAQGEEGGGTARGRARRQGGAKIEIESDSDDDDGGDDDDDAMSESTTSTRDHHSNKTKRRPQRGHSMQDEQTYKILLDEVSNPFRDKHFPLRLLMWS
eukprot:c6897_g1_i2.p1 GENE.c6897_g1_i2~~c6897_g1_i2.p1  ORF type:complete len:121 (+),score=16.10 c6897_g1_i2:489-851(+)